MRKRSKYRPRGVLVNPVAYVIESITPVAKHDSFLVDLKIKNHAALTALTQGKAVRGDIDDLISMTNITEALYRLGFGTDYKDIINAGLDALFAVGNRGAGSNRFVLKAAEMSALNDIMELHDAQMSVITVGDMERALNIVKEEFRLKKMRRIAEKQT